jgi:hypothetical protein
LDRQNRIGRTGQAEEGWNWTGRTYTQKGQGEKDTKDRTASIRLTGRKGRTGQPDRKGRTGQSEQD